MGRAQEDQVGLELGDLSPDTLAGVVQLPRLLQGRSVAGVEVGGV